MATSEQREQESRWLARKAIRRASMHLLRAESLDDENGAPRLALSAVDKAIDDCRKAQAHLSRALTEYTKRKETDE